MNKRSTVISAIKHIQTDTVPYYADFTTEERLRLSAFYKKEDFEKQYGFYLNKTVYGWFEEVAGQPGHFRDEFGVVWNRTVDKDIGVIEYPLIAEISNYNLDLPEPDELRFRAELEKLMADRQDRFTVAGIGFTMFERAWSLLTMPETLIAMIASPGALGKLLDRICEYNLKIIDIALDYDVDCIHFGDDWGQQRGLIMGPAHWRKYIKPRQKIMYERVKKAGKYVSQHSCGDIYDIFPDLIEIGLDIYQTFQPEIYDIEKTKREYGRHLTFWGGISTQKLLPCADPDLVRSETLRIMRLMSRGGGYIASPTHAVPPDVPPENINAMLDAFLNQERYLG